MLDLDEGVRHVPVHLGPGCGDVGRDDVAEYVDDRGEEVFIHDGVEVGRHAERGVLVADAGEHEARVGPVLRDEQRRVGGDGAGEGALLVALGLVRAVEQVAFEGGVRVEEAAVEDRRDVADGGADGG
ncbi:hypothetical protein GCM10010922_02110 [Microbacterium sorbitolivorans]|nr:hypothetical protein GCM10010922_02110 [Microbacterium sorbitolivorans]